LKKKKFKKQFHKEFPWWDSCYLLEAMELWFTRASEKHLTEGHFLYSNKCSKQLKIASVLCKRLKEDMYFDKMPWYLPKLEHDSLKEKQENGVSITHTNKRFVYDNLNKQQEVNISDKQFSDFIRLRCKIETRQKKQDLEMLCNLMQKCLFNWWD